MYLALWGLVFGVLFVWATMPDLLVIGLKDVLVLAAGSLFLGLTIATSVIMGIAGGLERLGASHDVAMIAGATAWVAICFAMRRFYLRRHAQQRTNPPA